MDPDGSSTDLNAVDHQVIGIGPDLSRIAFEESEIVKLGRGKRMVHGVKTLGFIIPLQQRKIHYPERLVSSFLP